jgi:hypothetical protein
MKTKKCQPFTTDSVSEAAFTRQNLRFSPVAERRELRNENFVAEAAVFVSIGQGIGDGLSRAHRRHCCILSQHHFCVLHPACLILSIPGPSIQSGPRGSNYPSAP